MYFRWEASTAIETLRSVLPGVIELVQKLQYEKNDFSLQQGLDLLQRTVQDLGKVDDCLEESKVKYISLPDLPDLVMKHLLKFLSLADWNMLRQVSASMYHNVTFNNKHFRSYKIDLNIDLLPVFPDFFHESAVPVSLTLPGIDKMNNIDFMRDLGYLLGSLKTRIIGIDMHVNVIDKLKNCFLMPSLKTIKISADQDSDAITSQTCNTICAIIMKSRNLKRLELFAVKFPNDEAKIVNEYPAVEEMKLPKLTEVVFNDCTCNEVLARVLDKGSKSIKNLEVYGADISHLDKIEQKMESLERLVISYKNSVSAYGKGIESILANCKKVEKMALIGINLENAGMTGQGYKNLKDVKMIQCCSTSHYLQTLLTNISSNVKQISFTDCNMVIEDNFVCNFPSLKHIELFPGAETQVSRILELADKLEVSMSCLLCP